jgi:protein TonB
MAIAITASANKAFKAKYPKYLRNALVLAILFHAALFILTPPFEFKPYKLKEEQFEVVDVPPELDIPPPPQDIPQPTVPVEAASDEEAESEDVPETSFESFEDLPPPPPPTGGEAGVFLAFDEPPVLTYFEKPVYPDLAREAGIEGTVRVKVLVAEDGKVLAASVISSDVTPAMEKAALDAARKCRFSPAKQRTTPVKANVMVPFVFHLN